MTAARPRVGWGRVFGEFAVIVLGVLVALAVDGLADERADRISEKDFLERILADVSADTISLSYQLVVLQEKHEALQLANSVLQRELTLGDAVIFQRALENSTAFGWALLPLHSVAIDELTSTGGLGLITNSTVRQRILSYYANAGHRRNRITGRATDYPALIYRTVSPRIIGAFRQTDPRTPGDLARGDERLAAVTPEPALAAEAHRAFGRGKALRR